MPSCRRSTPICSKRCIRSIPFRKEEPKKTSLHLVRTIDCAGVHLRKNFLYLTIRTAAPIESPRIVKSEQVSKNRFHNELKLSSLDEIDDELLGLLKDASAPG